MWGKGELKQSQYGPREDWWWVGLLLMICLLLGPGCAKRLPGGLSLSTVEPHPAPPSQASPLHIPEQITSYPAAAFAPALSPDGRRLIFVSDRSGNFDLWLQELNSRSPTPPWQLTRDSATDTAPVWSPDGRRIAFTSHRSDPRGDIFIMTLPRRASAEKPPELERLTDLTSADGEPVWSPDGRFIVYTARPGPRQPENLWRLDLSHGARQQLTQDGGNRAAFSPDGTYLIYSLPADGTGHLWIMRWPDGARRQLTRGAVLDGFSAWSPDGQRLFFTRYAEDTNRDGRITIDDNPSLWRLDMPPQLFDSPADALPLAVQLTSSRYYSLYAAAGPDRVYFATNRLGHLGIWSLPPDGLIVPQPSAEAQMALAMALQDSAPDDVPLQILAFKRVPQHFPQARAELLAQAMYEVAIRYRRLGQITDATTTLQALQTKFPQARLYTGLAAVELVRLQAHEPGRDQHALLPQLEQILATYGDQPGVGAAALLAQGAIARELHEPQQALQAYDRLLSQYPMLYREAAQALYGKATIYALLQDTDSVLRSYLAVLQRFPEVRDWGARAANAAIDLLLGSLEGAAAQARLRELVHTYGNLPILPALAQRRLGDLYRQLTEPELARDAYQQVVQHFPQETEQVIAARFSLAELSTEAAHYQRALDIYADLAQTHADDRATLRQARQGYMALARRKAERERQQRDPRLALKTYLQLITFAPQHIAAYRGAVELYAELGDIDHAVQRYRQAVQDIPDSAAAHYALGLASTYTKPPRYAEAEQELLRARTIMAQSVHIHQALGFVYEQLGRQDQDIPRLELALSSYQTALDLNDRSGDRHTRANLLLNLGNVFYALENYPTAVQYYRQREAIQIDFAHPTTALLYHMHFGIAAFRSGDFQTSQRHLQQALPLAREAEQPALVAELWDRLGLSYQEDGTYAKAIEAFSQALELYRQQGNLRQAHLSLRNLANNRLFLARSRGEHLEPELLQRSLEVYYASLESLEHYTPPPRQTPDATGGALLSIQTTVSLSADDSQAVHGFDRQGEMKLIFTNIGRIYEEFGDYAQARRFFRQKLALIPDQVSGAETLPVLTEKALVLNQLGYFAYRLGDLPGALHDLQASMTACRQLQNAACLVINQANIGRLLVELAGTQPDAVTDGQLQESLRGQEEALQLLGSNPTLGRGLYPFTLRNNAGMLAYRLAQRVPGPTSAADPTQAVRQTLALWQRSYGFAQAALRSYHDALQLITQASDAAPSTQENPARLAAVLLHNLAQVWRLLGQDDQAQAALQQALTLAERFYLHDMQWKIRLTLAVLHPTSELAMLQEAIGVLESSPAALALAPFDSRITQLLDRLYGRTTALLAKRQAMEEAYIYAERWQAQRRIVQLQAMDVGSLFFARDLDQDLSREVLQTVGQLRTLQKQLATPGRVAAMLSLPHAQVATAAATSPALAMPATAEHDLQITYKRTLEGYGTLLEEIWQERPELATLFAVNVVEPVEIQELLAPDSVLVKYTLLPDCLLIWAIDQQQFLPALVQVPVAQLTTILNRVHTQSALSHQDIQRLSTWLVQPVANLLADKRRRYILPDARLLPLPWAALELEGKALLASGQTGIVHDGQHLLQAWQQRHLYHERLLVLGTGDQRDDAPGWYQAARNTAVGLTIRSNTETNREQFLHQVNVHDMVHLDTPLEFNRAAPLESIPRLGQDPQHRLWLDLRTFYQLRTQASLMVLSQVHLPPSAAAGPLIHVLNHSLLFAGFTSVLVRHGSPDAAYDDAFLRAFYTALKQYPAGEALRQAQQELRRQQPEHHGWRYFQLYGYLGMDTDERQLFAKEHYRGVLEQAAQALQQQDWEHAASALERAARLSRLLHSQQALPVIYQRLTEAYRSLQQYDHAIAAQQRLLALAQSDGTPAMRAEAHHTLGILYSDAEQFSLAVQHLQSAVALQQEHGLTEQLQRSYITLGIAQERGAAYQEALASFQRSLELSQQSGQIEDVGQQLRRLGRIYLLRLNDYATAKIYFERALEIFQASRDASQIVQVQLEIGRVYQSWGSFAPALDYFQRAAQLATDTEDQVGLAQAHIDLANTYWLRGEYQNAFIHQRQAARLAEATDAGLQKLLATSTLGLIYWTLNNSERALQLQEEALHLARQLGLKHEEATVYNNTGIIHRQQQRFDAARGAFEHALEIDLSLKTRWGQAYDHRNLGMTYLQQGDLDQARQHLQQAVQLSQTIGDRTNTAKALLSLGDTQQQVGDLAAAQGTYEAALTLARQVGLPEVEWRTLYGLGRLWRTQHQASQAVDYFRQAIAVVEALRAAIKVEELRNGFLSDKLDLYEDLIFLLLQQGRSSDAFNYAERARARSFIDLLGNRQLNLENTISSELLATHRTLQGHLHQLRQALNQAAPEQRATLQRELARQSQRYQELLFEIKSANPQLSTFVTVDPLTLTEVQHLLEPGVALVEYLVGTESTVIWAITRQQLSVHQVAITRQELSRRVRDYRQHLGQLLPDKAEAQALYDVLVRPVAAFIEPSTYVGIIPHDILHYLSFAALHDGERYLLDAHALFYIPSASVLRFTLAKRHPGRRQTAVLAVGNPDLGALNYDLPLAEKEVYSLRWPFPRTTILTRDQALESRVVQDIDKYGIIHIASHGEFDSINPLFSALRLARDAQADGNLEVSEIFGLKVQADLVTLSACQTGLGVILRGDELIGLNRAFMYAGTHALISTLWRIDDLASALLMKHFYRFYTHSDKAESLRQAQLTVRQQFPHPSHWAGFVLSGDYK
jgi:tetratricopeptide (TPR) repeat protein